MCVCSGYYGFATVIVYQCHLLIVLRSCGGQGYDNNYQILAGLVCLVAITDLPQW